MLNQSDMIGNLRADFETIKALATKASTDSAFIKEIQTQFNITSELITLKEQLEGNLDDINIDLSSFGDSIGETVDSVKGSVDSVIQNFNYTVYRFTYY